MTEDASYQALYLHIPFCTSRCSYCDFETEAVAADDPVIDSYVEQLVQEIQAAARADLLGRIKTIYVGGGTPSHMGARRLEPLIHELSYYIDMNEVVEFTVEANPDSVTAMLVHDLRAYGVNRFSLGVQSFQDDELITLGRIHTADKAHDAIKSALQQCHNVSIDLICGIPGQDLSSWHETLDAALEHDITHISVYPLTIEDETPLARAITSGRLQEADEDLQAEMMLAAQERLAQAGFVRYEVASYARHNHCCHHNIAYWTGVPYLGLGKHAAGMRMNPLTGNRERLYGGTVSETLSPVHAALEDIMLGMRLAQGVSQTNLNACISKHPELDVAIMKTFRELVGLGLLEKTQTHYVPTTHGWLLGNELFSRIWAISSLDS